MLSRHWKDWQAKNACSQRSVDIKQESAVRQYGVRAAEEAGAEEERGLPAVDASSGDICRGAAPRHATTPCAEAAR